MYQKVTLKNGVRVLLVPDGHTKAATVFVMYRVGSRYEQKKYNGVSHFIEHMMFKGTKRRPATVDISRELDAVGADYNAFTGKDFTGYYVKIDSRHFSLALDMLHDMLYHSKFEDKELNQERKVIMEEIHMYHDNPMRRIDDLIEEVVFRGSSLGRDIAGDKQSMDAITRSAMLAYKNAYYSPERTIVVVSGNIDANAKKAIVKLFGAVPKRRKAKDFPRYAGKHDALRVALEYKEVDQIQLALAFPAYPHTDKRLPALSLLANILGGTMSSRLFIKIRERLGLAYFVRAVTDPYEDTGSFLIRAGLTKGRIDEAISAICAELARVKSKGVTAAELKRAKENIRGRVVLELEDSSDLAGFFGKQELYTNKVKTPEEKFAEINAVTAADVKAVAKDVIRQSRASLALIGPFKDAKRFSGLIRL
jgi:predicted Zn-dependent peptidase